MKALNGFLMTHSQMTLTDVMWVMLENIIGHACRTLS